MRPIDADALISNIKSEFEGAAGLMASSGALFAVMALKSAPTIPLEPQWTSTEDDLPNEWPTYVLVSCSDGLVCESCLFRGRWWDQTMENEVHNVTHWMHKPAPARKEEAHESD